MMEVGLEIEALWHDAHRIGVRITAWNGAFGGTGDVYVGIDEFQEAAERFAGFPLNPEDVREFTFGSFDKKSASAGVSTRLYCRDRAGHAFADLRIESDPFAIGQRQTAAFSLSVEAAAVDIFVAQLRRLNIERAGHARLEARTT